MYNEVRNFPLEATNISFQDISTHTITGPELTVFNKKQSLKVYCVFTMHLHMHYVKNPHMYIYYRYF